jgi:hypothetical protein
MSAFKCQECGKKFKTARAAERASYDGCPKCGGCDIDIDTDTAKPRMPVGYLATRANENSGQ